MLKAKLFNSKFQVFHGTGKPFGFEQKQLAIELNEGEALVKIVLATICGSDLHTIEGKRREDVPCILGHEAVGEIVEIKDRTGFAVGDRVTWTIADSCGKCAACTDYGLPEKCKELFKYGHASINKGSGLNGCYSNIIHIRRGTHLVKVPEVVDNPMAAPANCALATMVNAVSQLKNMPKKVVVQGGGLLGVYACALLKEKGVDEIYCLDINLNRFEIIGKFGAHPVDGRDMHKATSFLLDRLGDGADAIFEVAGVKELIPQGISLLRPGGQYILVGLVHPDSELKVTAEQIIRKCLAVNGIHNYAPWHLEEAIHFLERNHRNFPFDELVSPPFDLESIEEAVLEAKKQRWFRVSVKPKA
ncbi:zinc-binding dehydrogenase [Arenibacter sp. M-2]|uniref:zinc-binding dehydrogenase n=1 Tax=Arenibacter sp. M-2 TaxID=3053612 RepID=UPI0025701954|nr:zinc-binding dehydrogenase [Arenibacter sp. M-2]MDL5512570.1 zinc-binding dehydrogenase [Arenibacter sp. M-2]